MSDVITAEDLAVLTRWDTPTICNALEEIVPERRGHGFTTQHLFALDPNLPPVCGFARTATIRAAEAPPESDAEMLAKRTAYYEYVAAGPMPTIAVIQDLDPQPGIGAFWGEVQTTVHKGLGVLGAVTNGSFRDLSDSRRIRSVGEMAENQFRVGLVRVERAVDAVHPSQDYAGTLYFCHWWIA